MSNKVIMFTGSKCDACDTMKPLAVKHGVEIVNAEEYPIRARRYHVRSVPTFVATDDDGFYKSHEVGAISERKLLELFGS